MSLDSITFFQRNAHLVRNVRSHCLASLTFMAWDTLLTFSDEVDYIWSIPWKSKVKWLYFFLRYIPLAGHGAFQLAIVHLTSGYAPASTCRAWMIFVWTLVQVTSTLFEFVLGLCAYALFNRSRLVALLLGALIGGEIIISGLTLRGAVVEMPFETVCTLVSFPKGDAVYASFVAAVQSTLAWLILSKSYLAFRTGWGRTPLVSFLIKRVIITYGILIVFISLSFAVILRSDNRAATLFMWANPILATCACRLIIGLESLGSNTETRSQESVFTSQIAL
ncbi:hypothetical protein F5I97DRAFT_1305679 [Phlebopus sp. FC_14]|nr:hypothetical protein F5I97DRAFT_1305679 [Phlebopus sp. FC_14]